MRKYLLATAAYSNPELLLKCVNSWPRITKQLVYFDKLNPDSGIYDIYTNYYWRFESGMCLSSTRHLGVSGTWNEIIKFAFIDCEFDVVIIVGSDTEMAEGFLEGFIKEYEEQNLELGLTREHKWNCFALSSKCYETVGEFDLNFFPAYYEDNDYLHRVKLSGLPYAYIGDSSLFKHYGSATINLDYKAKVANNVTFGMNGRYYLKKWGGLPNGEIFKSPYGKPELGVKDWTLDENEYQMKKALWKDC